MDKWIGLLPFLTLLLLLLTLFLGTSRPGPEESIERICLCVKVPGRLPCRVPVRAYRARVGGDLLADIRIPGFHPKRKVWLLRSGDSYYLKTRGSCREFGEGPIILDACLIYLERSDDV